MYNAAYWVTNRWSGDGCLNMKAICRSVNTTILEFISNQEKILWDFSTTCTAENASEWSSINGSIYTQKSLSMRRQKLFGKVILDKHLIDVTFYCLLSNVTECIFLPFVATWVLNDPHMDRWASISGWPRRFDNDINNHYNDTKFYHGANTIPLNLCPEGPRMAMCLWDCVSAVEFSSIFCMQHRISNLLQTKLLNRVKLRLECFNLGRIGTGTKVKERQNGWFYCPPTAI